MKYKHSSRLSSFRNRCLFLFIALAFIFTAAPDHSLAEQTDQPNILFFLTDDHRHDQLGCAGHPILKTPEIDLLAKRGARFENAFVTTSICAASRATIFSGLYERSHRYTFGTPPIRTEVSDLCYPKLMRNAGYKTGFVGKFGVGVENGAQKEWFDYFQPLNRNPYFKKQADGSLRHVTEIAGDKAIEFLETLKPDQRFCLQVSFNAAHAEDGDKVDHFPWPKAVDGMYDDVKLNPPKLNAKEIFNAHPEFMKKSMNRDRFFWRWDTDEKYDRNLRAYYRMLSGIDRVVGRVMAQLSEQGLDKNTIVIFCGDNGYYMAQRGFAGKWSHYEESLRVPLIVTDLRESNKHAGIVPSEIILNVDVPATILNAAGVDIPNSYQGKSLMKLAEGKKVDNWRTDFFCEHLMNNQSIPKWEGVRGQRYVYARYFQQSPVYEYLHDLEADPDQLTNLASTPDAKAILLKMRKRCDELMENYGGEYDVANFSRKKPNKANKK